MYYFIFALTIGSNLIDGLGSVIVAAIGSIITSYVFIREKLLKNEAKNEQMVVYVDSKIQLLDNKILELQKDISDFKEINKETARSLTENTAAIRELKFVLNMLREQLNNEKRVSGKKDLLGD